LTTIADPAPSSEALSVADHDRFDLVVIGAGSGGLAAAKRAASHGARVAVIEGDRVGGTCVIRGCVPKKLLVYGSAYRHLLADAASYGWSVGQSHCDPSRLLAAVRAEVDRLNSLHIGFLERAGVELVRGWGRCLDAHHVEVGGAPGHSTDSSDGRSDDHRRLLRGERLLIATGGRPHRPSIPGAELGWVSDDMFLLERLPQRVLIVGGGFIACEFDCILRGLGVEVDQFVRGDQLLRGFDRELSAAVHEGMEADGITLHFAQTLTAITAEAGDLIASTCQGRQERCGGVLLATGRQPFLAGLDLAAAGVVVEGGRIPVDADQRTNVPHIFAVGDVTDRVNLTPVAVDEGRAFADSVYGGRPRQVDHDLVASAVFSQPELATVGLSEEKAVARLGTEGVRLYRARFRSMAQALPQRGPRCLLKLVVEVASGRVLGCHMVGEHAAEIIQMAAIAIGMGATKADFDRTMALHPTVAEEFVTMPD